MFYCRKEHQRMERVLSDLQRQHDETKRKKEQQLSQLETIKADTNAEIIEIRSVLKGPADEYLRTLNQLQNRISKIQAYSCFEDGKLKHVTIHPILSLSYCFFFYNIVLVFCTYMISV